MKMNQKGVIDLMLVAVLIVVLAVGGFVVWRVQDSGTNANNSSETTQTETVAEQQSTDNTRSPDRDIPDGWVEFNDETLGFSFIYPEDWVIESQYSGVNDASMLQVNLRSPDYVRSTEGYGQIIKGAELGVSIDSIKNSGVAHETVSSILDGTYGGKSVLGGQKELSVSGIAGVEYTSVYEGPAYLVSQFDSGDMAIYFFLEAENGPNYDSYVSQYRQIVDSFKI